MHQGLDHMPIRGYLTENKIVVKIAINPRPFIGIGIGFGTFNQQKLLMTYKNKSGV